MQTRVLKDYNALPYSPPYSLGYIVQIEVGCIFTRWKDVSIHDDEQRAIEKAKLLGTYIGMYSY